MPGRRVREAEVKDFRTGEVKAFVSQVNAGVIRKDLKRLPEARKALKKFTTAQLLDICARAYLKAARTATISNVRLCLRDQPVIDAVLKELKR